MVFSFFKKKDAEPAKPEIKQPRLVQPKPPAGVPPAEPKSAPAPAPVAPMEGATLDFTTNIGNETLSSARIDVHDTSETISPAMEQAAISFANDQVDEAISVLAQAVQSTDGQHALDTWLMLFDLYQMRGKRTEYDELALKFVVEFERSAPVWQQRAKDNKEAKATPAKPGGPSVLFPAKLQGEAANGPLDQIEKLAAGGVVVKLDFSRTVEIDGEAIQAILQRWPKFKKARYKFQAAGAPQLADLLKTRIEVMRRQDEDVPYWLFLLEIFQLLGLQEDFENTAVDYAVTFEVSPPSWDSAAKTKTIAEVAAEDAKVRAEAAAAAPALDAFAFNGAVVGGAESAFQPLLEYANTRLEVVIDFSDVTRVDFVSCGMLMNALVAITAQSKHVAIIGANELVVALFRIMGISDVAQIIRKK